MAVVILAKYIVVPTRTLVNMIVQNKHTRVLELKGRILGGQPMGLLQVLWKNILAVGFVKVVTVIVIVTS